MNIMNLSQKLSPEEIAKRATKIYNSVKSNYEPHDNGKFLAIEPESESIFQGITVAEAVEQARIKYPDRLFFIIKIGFSTVESMAQAILSRV